MNPSNPPPSFRPLFAILTLLITYGSLFPFRFRSADLSDEISRHLLTDWSSFTGTGDILGNIILFLPFGLVGVLCLRNRRSVASVVGMLVAGALFASALQIAQIYLPMRSPSLTDILWNIVGLGAGAALAYWPLLRHPIEDALAAPRKSIPLLLIGAWLAAELIPFVPTLDAGEWWQSVKPLLQGHGFGLADTLFLTTSWLAVALVAENVAVGRWRHIYLPVAIAGVTGLKIAIIARYVSVTDIVVLLAATGLWFILHNAIRRRPDILAWTLLAAYSISMLAPFNFQGPAGPFDWVPFGGFLDGNMIANSASLCQKLFLFGTVFWLLRKAGHRRATLWIVAAVAGAIEISQMWLAGHSAEVTDPLLALAVGGFMASRPAADEEPDIIPARHPAIPETAASQAPPRSVPARLSRATIGLVVAVPLAMILVLHMILQLPGVPYNVLELFRHNGSLLDLLLFCTAILGFGFGSAWAARRILASPRPYFAAPGACGLVILVIYGLFAASVTRESLMDVTGSTVFISRILNRGVLGDTGIGIVHAMGENLATALAGFIEPIIRFEALFAPFIFALVLAFLLALRTRPASAPGMAQVPRNRAAGTIILYILCMLPWLWLAKFITFDVSSTDNLNELIARDGEWGLGGGGYLYALVLLMSVAAAMLAVTRSLAMRGLALALTAASIPIGWWLINQGLIQSFTKYGLTYSGVDFLLGPDRSTKLPAMELFLRWSVVQLGGTMVLAAGGWMALRLFDRRLGLPSQAKPVPSSNSKRLIDSLQAQRLRRAMTKQGPYMHPILVNYTAAQARFIDSLAQHMERPQSNVVASIVMTVKEILDAEEDERREDFIKVIVKEPRTPGATYRQEPLVLPASEMAFVTEIAKSAGTSHSCAVRHIVAFFVENVEDGESDDDDEEETEA